MKPDYISRSTLNPERVLAHIKKRWRFLSKGNKLTDYYDSDDAYDRRVLIIVPIRAVYTSKSQYYRRPNMWIRGHKIMEIFNNLGFVVDICDINDELSPPVSLDDYDVIFGGGSNFRRFIRDSGDSVLGIYFSAGRHWNDCKKDYEKRIEYLEDRKDVKYEPQRPSLLESRSIQNEDAILCMGGPGTRSSWIKNTDNSIPVRDVPVSHPPDRQTKVTNRGHPESKNNFLWFGGNGLVLKGLDIVLDAFKNRSEELYICGPVKKSGQFRNIYSDELYNSENIHVIGWTDIYSDKYYRVMEKCGYLIYPSASEGMSGAVATSMWQGLIPVITEQVYDPVDEWGFKLSDAKVEKVESVVENLSQNSLDEFQTTSNKSYKFARDKHDRNNVSETIKNELVRLLRKFDIYI